MKELFTEVVWDEERKFWHRGPADIFVGDEMKTYKALKNVPEYNTALDLGGHIGWFTRYCLQELNVSAVHAVEPDPSSAAIYYKNHGGNGRVLLHEAAAVSDGSTELFLQLNPKYPANNRSDRTVRGRSTVRVATIDLQRLISAIDDLELVKIDVEGAEYGLDLMMPSTVKAVAIEYHQFDEYMLEGQRRIHQSFLDQGFKVVKDPKDKVTFQKITTGVYIR